MTDTLHNTKPYNKTKKFYFPSKSTFKPRHSKKRKKKPNKWINLDNTVQYSKTEHTICIDDSLEEDVCEFQRGAQEFEKSGQLSPILKYTVLNGKSPVIGNRPIKDDYLIKDSFSSDSEAVESHIEIEEQTSVTSNRIDEFLSQDCTKVEENYYVPIQRREAPSKRKKPFNKNGLARCLQTALLRQSAEVTFWKHEREFHGDVVQLPSLLIRVKNISMQFGVCILECEDLNKTKNCLVMLGSAVTSDVCTIPNSEIQIFEPYLTKNVKYKGDFVHCYYNISKFINL